MRHPMNRSAVLVAASLAILLACTLTPRFVDATPKPVFETIISAILPSLSGAGDKSAEKNDSVPFVRAVSRSKVELLPLPALDNDSAVGLDDVSAPSPVASADPADPPTATTTDVAVKPAKEDWSLKTCLTNIGSFLVENLPQICFGAASAATAVLIPLLLPTALPGILIAAISGGAAVLAGSIAKYEVVKLIAWVKGKLATMDARAGFAKKTGMLIEAAAREFADTIRAMFNIIKIRAIRIYRTLGGDMTDNGDVVEKKSVEMNNVVDGGNVAEGFTVAGSVLSQEYAASHVATPDVDVPTLDLGLDESVAEDERVAMRVGQDRPSASWV